MLLLHCPRDFEQCRAFLGFFRFGQSSRLTSSCVNWSNRHLLELFVNLTIGVDEEDGSDGSGALTDES